MAIVGVLILAGVKQLSQINISSSSHCQVQRTQTDFFFVPHHVALDYIEQAWKLQKYKDNQHMRRQNILTTCLDPAVLLSHVWKWKFDGWLSRL